MARQLLAVKYTVVGGPLVMYVLKKNPRDFEVRFAPSTYNNIESDVEIEIY